MQIGVALTTSDDAGAIDFFPEGSGCLGFFSSRALYEKLLQFGFYLF